tara:strand:- start:327 stop:710 length:384 start_codon:yes stop_codon:yes gene_type:complete
MLSFRGYIFSRKIDNNFIPHRVQNLVIKDYCEKKKYFFKLSATEYKMKNSYLMLNSLLKNLNKIDGIIFYSLFMLPQEKEQRNRIYKIIIKKNKQIHFALEDIQIKKLSDIYKIENIYQIKQNTKTI